MNEGYRMAQPTTRSGLERDVRISSSSAAISPAGTEETDKDEFFLTCDSSVLQLHLDNPSPNVSPHGEKEAPREKVSAASDVKESKTTADENEYAKVVAETESENTSKGSSTLQQRLNTTRERAIRSGVHQDDEEFMLIEYLTVIAIGIDEEFLKLREELSIPLSKIMQALDDVNKALNTSIAHQNAVANHMRASQERITALEKKVDNLARAITSGRRSQNKDSRVPSSVTLPSKTEPQRPGQSKITELRIPTPISQEALDRLEANIKAYQPIGMDVNSDNTKGETSSRGDRIPLPSGSPVLTMEILQKNFPNLSKEELSQFSDAEFSRKNRKYIQDMYNRFKVSEVHKKILERALLTSQASYDAALAFLLQFYHKK